MSDLSEGLRLFITNTAPRSRLDVGGEIDLATIDALREHLALLVEAGTGDIDVDMAAVTFCDATVLRVLFAAHQTLDSDGRHIQIINASAPTTRLLQLAGLDTVLLAPPHREPPHPPRTFTAADGRARQERAHDADRQTHHRPLS
jgi:anti-sigma B factor antagonist